MQFPFVTNELIPRMMFVPDWKLGPPESPKQVPPLSPVGFAESFRNSGASLFSSLTITLCARIRKPSRKRTLPPGDGISSWTP